MTHNHFGTPLSLSLVPKEPSPLRQGGTSNEADFNLVTQSTPREQQEE